MCNKGELNAQFICRKSVFNYNFGFSTDQCYTLVKLGLIFFNTWFTDFFSKYYGRRREKNKNKNY